MSEQGGAATDGGGQTAVLDPGDAPELADVAGLPTGPELVCLLAGRDPTELPAKARVDALVGWERALAWAAAQQQRVLAAMPVEKDARDGTDYTVHEVALALRARPGLPRPGSSWPVS